eukprot:scaffold68059_cov37-Prasinocladus_malaysianus.AAC.2
MNFTRDWEAAHSSCTKSHVASRLHLARIWGKWCWAEGVTERAVSGARRVAALSVIRASRCLRLEVIGFLG